jgi:predicted deacylase
MKTVRNYNKLVTELINLNLPYRLEIMGYVTYDEKIYPMLALKYTSKMAKKTVIITAGQHGDEPFGVTTLIKWLKQPIMFPEFNYYIFPIVNPFGYEKNYRDNGNRQDTNNDANFVKDSKVPELSILYDQFPQTADLILDIHGDTGKEQIYAYEHKSESLPSIATLALAEIDAIIPYLRAKTIYKIKVRQGVIIPPKWDVGIEGFMEKLGVSYTITIELPGKFDGQKRAEGGVTAINSILKNFKEAVCKEKE